jgi:hypothetical protein
MHASLSELSATTHSRVLQSLEHLRAPSDDVVSRLQEPTRPAGLAFYSIDHGPSTAGLQRRGRDEDALPCPLLRVDSNTSRRTLCCEQFHDHRSFAYTLGAFPISPQVRGQNSMFAAQTRLKHFSQVPVHVWRPISLVSLVATSTHQVPPGRSPSRPVHMLWSRVRRRSWRSRTAYRLASTDLHELSFTFRPF